MEFLRIVRRKSVVSESVYIILNIALAAAVLAAVWGTSSPWLGLSIALISKWRILAVRPRYWFTHLEANMVDIIVSIGVVVLIYLAGLAETTQGLVVQIILAILYGAWLLLLKPRGNRKAIAMQAGVAVTVGSMALVSVSYEWPSTIVVLGMWLIGYTSARHVLASYSEDSLRLLGLVWGFVTAEIGWLTYHWAIGYPLPYGAGLKIPQVTLILLGLGFIAERVYSSFQRHEKIKRNDVLLPILLTTGVLLVIFIFFDDIPLGVA